MSAGIYGSFAGKNANANITVDDKKEDGKARSSAPNTRRRDRPEPLLPEHRGVCNLSR